MWIARNKSGDLRLFEMPPRRFHEGAALPSELVGFNDAVTVGDGKDEYSFWAHQEHCESNRIDDKKEYGIRLMTEKNENGKKIWYSYVPDCVKNMKWEDEPIEVEIHIK